MVLRPFSHPQMFDAMVVVHATSKNREDFYQDLKTKYSDVSILYGASEAGEVGIL